MSQMHKGSVAKGLDMSAIEIIRARRACTVPQQLLKSHELPALPNTRAVPKRYEETKPVKVQNFTHQRIIDMGELINKQSAEEVARQHQLAIDRAVADTWQTAQEIKTQAITEALGKAQLQQEKQLRKLSKHHERALKEQALAVESMMQNKMREALEAQRTEAQAAHEEAIEQLKTRCSLELKEAVALARKEEQEKSRLEKEELVRQAEATLRTVKSDAAEDKQKAVDELIATKDAERVSAVQEVTRHERQVAEEKLAALKRENELAVAMVWQNVEELKCVVKEKVLEVEKIQKKREELYDELMKVQADYQNFIDRFPLFDSGQTGYLLRDVHDNPRIINPYEDIASFTASGDQKRVKPRRV